MFEIECPKCREKSKAGARFCGNCGEPLPGSQIKCGNCGAVVAGDKKFCGNCGKPLAESAAPLLTGNRWARRVEDFATKVEVDDVEGFFRKGLIVEAGTKAIFFVNGALSGILEPGKYDMGGLLQRIKLLDSKSSTAVLVDTGDVELQFSVSDLPTRDPIRLAAECRIVVQMDNPAEFFENMMKGRQNYPLTEMKSFLEGELRNCMLEFIGSKSVRELSSNLAFKYQLEQDVARHLANTFGRKGLSFVQVRIFDFRHPRIDAMTQKMEEYWLDAEDLKARLAGQDSTVGLERRLLDQETARSIMELEVYEDRARVRDRMRKAVARSSMDELTTAAEMEKFLQNIDKDKLLREDEMRELVRGFAEKQEDHDLARRHLIQTLSLEQQLDLQKAALLGKIALQRTGTDAVRSEEMAQLEHELDAQRKEMQLRQLQEWAKVKQEVDARLLQAQTEIRIKKEQGLTDIELEEAQNQADMRAAQEGLKIVREQKAIKREEADWESQRRAREEEQRHGQEMERIEKLSTASTEVLISLSPADRAPILAELQRTRYLQGRSAEEIMALAADKNSEVAKAFQEKWRGASPADVQREHERMLELQEKARAEMAAFADKALQRMQEMYNRGMDTQRDTASAAARGGQPATTVVIPGSGVIQTGGSGGVTGRRVVCPECHRETDEGNKFCDNCGHKFFA